MNLQPYLPYGWLSIAILRKSDKKHDRNFLTVSIVGIVYTSNKTHMNILKYRKIVAFACLIGVFASCQNDPLKDLTVEDSQVFFTNYDKSVDFKQFKTFSIVDSVLIYGNRGNGATLTQNDIKFLNAVVQNMQQMGYQYVSPKENPDLGMNVAQVRNAYLNVVSRPISPYWGGGGFGGGFGPGFGYGYPSTYSYVQTQENYWTVEMLDFKNPDTANKKVNVIWNATIRGNGLFDGIDADNIVRSIFEQSPYLKAN